MRTEWVLDENWRWYGESQESIDISDLVELEENPKESLKEVQNILLRHNSELKHWYRIYSRKIEAHKCEESFAMTLK